MKAQGKDRRCRYEDGDVEDLSVAELKALARLDPQNKSRGRSISPKSGINSGNSSIASSAKSGQDARAIRRSGRELTTNVKLADYQHLQSHVNDDGDQKPAAVRKSSRDRRPPRTYEEMLIAEQQQYQNKRSAPSKPTAAAKIQKLLSSLDDDYVPIDKAAEGTCVRAEDPMSWDDIEPNSDTDHNEWLEKVASELGARPRPMSRNSALLSDGQPSYAEMQQPMLPSRPMSRNSSVLSSDCQRNDFELSRGKSPSVSCNSAVSSVHQQSDLEMQQLKTPSKVAASAHFQQSGNMEIPASVLVSRQQALPSPEVTSESKERTLIDIEKGSRHEYLVFRKDDPDRTVGEVLIEGKQAWVEVCFGGPELIKCRCSSLIPLPRYQFNVGDHVSEEYMTAVVSEAVPSHSVPLKSAGEFKASPNEKNTSEKKPSRTKQHTVNLDDIFYWVCDCEAFNTTVDRVCQSCRADRTINAKTSKLLEIALDVVDNDYVASLEEAIVQIPEADRQSIPELVLAQLLEAKFAGMNLTQFSAEPSTKIDSYFYWSCGSCTMQNSYKKSVCYACRDSKGYFARASPLLQIAEKIASQSKTPDDAYARWPVYETRQIPEVIMDALITCVHIIRRKGTERRCRNRKLEGFDYCQDHCDPSLLTAAPRIDDAGETDNAGTDQCVDDGSTPSSSLQRRASPMGIETLKQSLHTFFTSKIDTIRNTLGWSINSIEDTLICGSDSKPFPLGLKVRTYFLNYGLHDGRIIKVCNM
jgi:hypothetical protein